MIGARPAGREDKLAVLGDEQARERMVESRGAFWVGHRLGQDRPYARPGRGQHSFDEAHAARLARKDVLIAHHVNRAFPADCETDGVS